MTETNTYRSRATRNVRRRIGIDEVKFTVRTVEVRDPKKFSVQPVAMDDGGEFFPPGFKGTGLSCTQCHVKGMMNEDSPYGGPALRGHDTVFSWYPAKVVSVDRDFYTPELDYRWPIEVR